MLRITRNSYADLVREVVRGQESLDHLRGCIDRILIAEDAEIDDRDNALVLRVMYTFDDESLSDAQKMSFAEQIVSALDSRISNSSLLELIPAILNQERLCRVVREYRGGKITRTGLLSYLSSVRFPRQVYEWLRQASLEELEYLCKALKGADITEAAHLLALE